MIIDNILVFANILFMKSDIYSVLGNQIRSKLILCLSQKPKNVTELISNCGLAQSAVSQHLTKLKQSGIVRTKKDGKEIYYSLKYKKAADIVKLIMSLEKEVDAKVRTSGGDY
jgi:DNA-binding transcriptional ArsR family regulator